MTAPDIREVPALDPDPLDGTVERPDPALRREHVKGFDEGYTYGRQYLAPLIFWSAAVAFFAGLILGKLL